MRRSVRNWSSTGRKRHVDESRRGGRRRLVQRLAQRLAQRVSGDARRLAQRLAQRVSGDVRRLAQRVSGNARRLVQRVSSDVQRLVQRRVVVGVLVVDVTEFQELAGTPEVDQEVRSSCNKGKGPELAPESTGGQESQKCDSCESQGVECVRPKVSPFVALPEVG